MILVLALIACGTSCDQACQTIATRVNNCLVDWSADWDDLGAADRSDFVAQCQSDWDATAAELESRELDAALAACDQVVQERGTLSCDELRAIYLD